MSLENKILIAVVSTVIVIFVVIIAIFALKHEEPTLMGACWKRYSDGDKVSFYEKDGVENCPELTWDKNEIPLTVKTTAYHQDSKNEAVTAVETAVRHTNQLLGFEGFSPTTKKNSNILITIGVPKDKTWDNPGGRTYHKRDLNKNQKAFIDISNIVDQTLLNFILVHELLHALGLCHDDWEGSIMYPSGNAKEFVRIKQLWLSDLDKKVLRSLYSPN